MILAAVAFGGYGLVEVAILVVVVAALCAVVIFAVRGMGLAVPQWVFHILGVVVVCVVAIVAIKIIASLF